MQHWICIDMKSGWSNANIFLPAAGIHEDFWKWPNFAYSSVCMNFILHTFLSKEQKKRDWLMIALLWASVIKGNQRDSGPADELPLNKSTHLNALALLICSIRTKRSLAHCASVAYVNTLFFHWNEGSTGGQREGLRCLWIYEMVWRCTDTLH